MRHPIGFVGTRSLDQAEPSVQDGVVPPWRPASATDPDGENEQFFTALEVPEPELAAELIARYGRRWLAGCRLSATRQPEVPDTVELVVAPEWDEPPESRLMTLRLRSWYTGSTYWFNGWDGNPNSAEAWIDQVADLQAANVEDERRYGPTPWDDERVAPPPPPPSGASGVMRGIIEPGDPGTSGFTTTTEFAFSPTPTAETVREALAHLDGSPDVPVDLAVEARALAETGVPPTEFLTWLAGATRSGDGPSEPIDCGCGAALLDPATWTGRAIVRCGACGSRWGIEVVDSESRSRWMLDP